MDLLNLSANERLDLADLTYAIFDSQLGLHRQIINNVVMDPVGAQKGYVLSGFGLTNPSGSQLTVTRGVALLPYRSGPNVVYGLVSSEGTSSQTLDLSSRASGTYNVYITFTYAPGALDTRTLWAPDNGGAEYAESVPTRQVAGWQLLVESVNPGLEYLQIGTVTLPSMAIVDQRPLLFEGRPDQTFVPSWGTGANDRSTARGTYPITNLATFISAIQQCLIDIKGPGIAKWYTPYIAGQTIGFAGTAKVSSTAWFDANFYIQGDANNPRTVYSADGANFAYLRGSNCFALQGGTGATGSTLNFPLATTTLGTKGPYSLTATASSFALMDTANAINPLVYTPASESLDLSATGLGTVIMPNPPNIKYPSTQVLNQYVNLIDGTLLTGLMFYTQGASYTVSPATYPSITGELIFGFPSGTAQNAIGATWICPLTVPAPCTITTIEIGTYGDGSIAGQLALWRKDNSNSNSYNSSATPTVSTNAPTRIASCPAGYQNVTISGGFSSVTAPGYGTRAITFTENVNTSDLSTYFLQLGLYQVNAATTSADTASSYRFKLNSIKIIYQITGPTTSRHG